MAQLPAHQRVLGAVLGFFRPRAVWAFVCGSALRGGPDEESDLDIGIVLPRPAATPPRRAMGLGDRTVVPPVRRRPCESVLRDLPLRAEDQADISLYTRDQLPPAGGGPYVVARDDTGR
jgi:predicted nucleotidyltransferase